MSNASRFLMLGINFSFITVFSVSLPAQMNQERGHNVEVGMMWPSNGQEWNSLTLPIIPSASELLITLVWWAVKSAMILVLR